jgi:hypothetical protein
MRQDNLDDLTGVLREIEYASYERRDSNSNKVGIYIVIDDPTLDHPQVSLRNVSPQTVKEEQAENRGKTFMNREIVKAFGQWRRRVDYE